MEEVRIGVYVCHCGVNIAATVDVKEVARYAGTLPSVVLSRDYVFVCSDPGQELIRNDIKEYGLNRVIVASCSPRLHELTFRRVCESVGLNPYLFEMVNIREQCSWTNEDKEANTEKAKALVKAAVRRVFYHEPLEIKYVPYNSNTLVVGGGIAGIQAALDIANSGHKVYLVEREPSIGGHMIQLDKTFPTLDCSQCILTPKMSEVGHHPYIELLAYSEVEEISGYIGNFKVKIRKKARHLDVSKCTGCSLCVEKCPYKTDSEFELGLAKRKAAYIPFPQAVPFVATIDPDICIYIKSDGEKCGACIKFCEAQAITKETLLYQTDEIIEVEVGSIILATGFDLMDPKRIPQYGYGKYENVVTGLEFERIVSPTGPTGGKIRLKDGREPESVAIVHCVGSRDKNYHEYCSRVCCMYALKQANYIKEELSNTDVYQFYIDMRSFGDRYEEFYERLSSEGVNFIRGKVTKVTRDEGSGKLDVIAEDTLLGGMIRVPVDMVILANAIEPQADAGEVASRFTISQKATGFFLERHPKLDPVATPTDGIFIAGCCQSPKDVPDTVAQASAAAAKVLAMISLGKVPIEAAVSTIDEEKCSGCQICQNLCPFTAISFDEEKKVCRINEALCKGCGVCAGACPSGAVTAKQFTNEEINAQIEGVIA